jgi:Transglutaminase-like superfamily
MSLVMPMNLDRLPPGPRVRLTVEVLSTYLHVRWVMRDDDAERSVRRLRTDARDSDQNPGPRRSPEPQESLTPASDGDLELLAALRLAHATRRVLQILPSDSRCLFRSLTLMCLLERREISQTLVVAVRPRPFAAHAWVEVEGQPVLPDADSGYERLLEL